MDLKRAVRAAATLPRVASHGPVPHAPVRLTPDSGGGIDIECNDPRAWPIIVLGLS